MAHRKSMSIELKYNNPDILHTLIDNLDDSNKLEIIMYPNNEEFLSILRKWDTHVDINGVSWEKIRELSKKYDINDCYGLVFDGIFPKVELFRKQGMRNREYADSLYVKGKEEGNLEEYYEYVSPIYSLAQISKWPWLYIRFHAEAGLQQSALVKKAVTMFRNNNYIAQQVYAGLNPKSRTSDHYYGYTEFSAQLWAGNGKIAMSGNLEGLLDEKNKTVLLEPLIRLKYKEIGE